MKKFLIICLFCFTKNVYAKDDSFECKTSKHTIIISEISDDHQARYRSWNLPKKTTEKPDLEIKKGKWDYEGTGICGSRVFKFKSGNVEYIASDGSHCLSPEAPENAVGFVDVEINGQSKNTYWCIHDKTKDADFIKIKNALAPECQKMRDVAVKNPINFPIIPNSDARQSVDLDINNDGKTDKIFIVENDNNYFSGSFLVALLNQEKVGVANFLKKEADENLSYFDKEEGGVIFNKNLNAYFISLGQAKSSIRYVFNVPFKYESKTYILATEHNTDNKPAQSISIIGADNKAKNLCKFPDVKGTH